MTLKDKNIALTDKIPDTNYSYFYTLFDLAFPKDYSNKPNEILDAIVKAGMAFDVNTNSKGCNGLFEQFPTEPKEFELVTRTLIDNFSLTAATKIDNTTFAKHFIYKTSALKLPEILKILLEANLLPEGITAKDSLPLLPTEIAKVLVYHMTDVTILKDIIDVLRNNFDLHELLQIIINHSWIDLALDGVCNAVLLPPRSMPQDEIGKLLGKLDFNEKEIILTIDQALEAFRDKEIKVDFLKTVHGKTLVDSLLSRVKSIDEFAHQDDISNPSQQENELVLEPAGATDDQEADV